jgi:hypothetical protein
MHNIFVQFGLVVYSEYSAEFEASFKYATGIIYRHLSYGFNNFVLENRCTTADPTLKHIILFILKKRNVTK